MANVTPKPHYITVDGILFPSFKSECIREALEYQAKPGDIFIATYPKCGTTWMQNIAVHIFRKGRELEDPQDFHMFSPFLENKGRKGIENMPRPGAIKTHLPFTHVPYSPDAKYIYVLRNPKDCCVSLYYHTQGGHRGAYSEATFNDFFEIFMAGEVEYNDYFDHLASWYPHRNDQNVFFTTYEDMKKDTGDVILKLARFLGQEYIDAIEKDNGILNNILHFSKFDYMKEHLSGAFKRGPKPTKDGHLNGIEKEMIEKCSTDQSSKKRKGDHMRKGIVGDWKNHFSGEQNERMNQKFTERTQGTEIFDMYKSYMGL